MQKIPLSDPRLAAVLIAIGVPQEKFRVEPLHHTGTGAKRASWFLETGEPQDILELLSRAQPEHPQGLQKTDPGHPFLTALAAIENHALLTKFSEGKPVKILFFTATEAHFAIPSLTHAVAFMTAGFPVVPEKCQPGLFAFNSHSIHHPELDYRVAMDALNRMADRSVLEPAGLPGYPPGRHPICYAFAAAHHLKIVAAAEAEAWKHPTHFFPGRGGRSAFANDATLQNNAFHRALRPHLAGT